MGTQKQADALVKIVATLRSRDGLPPAAPGQVAHYRSKVLGWTLAEVRAEFERVNAASGFSRFESPATDTQRALIWRLERQVYRSPQTTYRHALSYQQASERISELIAKRDAMTAQKGQRPAR